MSVDGTDTERVENMSITVILDGVEYQASSVSIEGHNMVTEHYLRKPDVREHRPGSLVIVPEPTPELIPDPEPEIVSIKLTRMQASMLHAFRRLDEEKSGMWVMPAAICSMYNIDREKTESVGAQCSAMVALKVLEHRPGYMWDNGRMHWRITELGRTCEILTTRRGYFLGEYPPKWDEDVRFVHETDNPGKYRVG